MENLEPVDAERYCREIEAYLCRKNDGHLIRIVGPAFERVCQWAGKGVPLKVAFCGIDRCFDRYYAKGPRRRPVRVEFCEADILDAYDEWRRAVGISLTGTGGVGADADRGQEGSAPRRESLPSHLDRAIARLTSLRSGENRPLHLAVDAVVRELDAARSAAKGLRGGARESLLARLRALDAELLEAGRRELDDAALAALRNEADSELAAFRGRLAADAYEKSRRACVDRLLRERLRLPVIAFD